VSPGGKLDLVCTLRIEIKSKKNPSTFQNNQEKLKEKSREKQENILANIVFFDLAMINVLLVGKKKLK